MYCANPVDSNYESCGIYIPGKYFDSTLNSNGTYTCTINENNQVGNYTSKSAPIVMPINTPGYSSCTAPSSNSTDSAKEYTDCGFIYLDAGCRGRDNGAAPDGVCDLKSAMLLYRFHSDVLAGDSEKIFTFGHSGGGAQSAIMGSSGNSELYNPYLESIDSAMISKYGSQLSNAVYGSMCWCPITNLDTADEAYEWNMGQYMRSEDSFESSLSDDLSKEYVKYINELNLKDSNSNTLTLENTTSGSYYDYILEVTQNSLNNFLNDTTFPYTPSNNNIQSSNVPAGGEMPNTNNDQSSNVPTRGEMPNTNNDQSGNVPNGSEILTENNDQTNDNVSTYETAKDYIDSLNSNDTWVEYDESTNTAKITSLEAFVKHCKNPSKSTPAFDDLERSQAENALFGIDSNSSPHFDTTVAELLSNNSDKYSKFSDYSNNYQTEYSNDLKKTDSQNNTIQTRFDMYNSMYYLCDYYNGSGSSDVAKYWRINTGIEQADTSQCVDVNLYLAVLSKVGSDNIEFSTVWGSGHTQAERTGNSTSNFINWVNNCCLN